MAEFELEHKKYYFGLSNIPMFYIHNDDEYYDNMYHIFEEEEEE